MVKTADFWLFCAARYNLFHVFTVSVIFGPCPRAYRAKPEEKKGTSAAARWKMLVGGPAAGLCPLVFKSMVLVDSCSARSAAEGN